MYPVETNSKGLMSRIMGKSRWGRVKVNLSAGRWARKYLRKGRLAGQALKGIVASIGMVGAIEVLKAIQAELDHSNTEGNQWITKIINELKEKPETPD